MDRVELYVDAAGEFRWRYVAANGRTLADSGEGYLRKRAALKAIERVLGIVTPDEHPIVPGWTYQRAESTRPVHVTEV